MIKFSKKDHFPSFFDQKLSTDALFRWGVPPHDLTSFHLIISLTLSTDTLFRWGVPQHEPLLSVRADCDEWSQHSFSVGGHSPRSHSAPSPCTKDPILRCISIDPRHHQFGKFRNRKVLTSLGKTKISRISVDLAAPRIQKMHSNRPLPTRISKPPNRPMIHVLRWHR